MSSSFLSSFLRKKFAILTIIILTFNLFCLQPNSIPRPVTSQPTVKPFIPSTPQGLRNVEQYQQPTLASHLFPVRIIFISAYSHVHVYIRLLICSTHLTQVNANSTYQQAGNQAGGAHVPVSSQVAPPAHKMQQGVTPTAGPRGFMQVNNAGVQRPGMEPMQPPSPTHSSAASAPVAPAAPPPTVQTADTSNVPGNKTFYNYSVKKIKQGDFKFYLSGTIILFIKCSLAILKLLTAYFMFRHLYLYLGVNWKSF